MTENASAERAAVIAELSPGPDYNSDVFRALLPYTQGDWADAEEALAVIASALRGEWSPPEPEGPCMAIRKPGAKSMSAEALPSLTSAFDEGFQSGTA